MHTDQIDLTLTHALGQLPPTKRNRIVRAAIEGTQRALEEERISDLALLGRMAGIIEHIDAKSYPIAVALLASIQEELHRKLFPFPVNDEVDFSVSLLVRGLTWTSTSVRRILTLVVDGQLPFMGVSVCEVVFAIKHSQVSVRVILVSGGSVVFQISDQLHLSVESASKHVLALFGL